MKTPTSTAYKASYIPSRYRTLFTQLGYDPDNTNERIAFQIRHDIIASAEDKAAGNVGPGTRSKLEAIAQEVANRTPRQKLQEGSLGDNVRALQNIMIDLGYLDAKVTGNFGPKTKAALIQYQLDEKLIETAKHPAAGYLGPGTHQALQKLAFADFKKSSQDEQIVYQLQADDRKTAAIARAEALAQENPGSDEEAELIDATQLLLEELGNEWIKEHTPAENNSDSNSELLPAGARRAKEDPAPSSKLILASSDEDPLEDLKSKLAPHLQPFLTSFPLRSRPSSGQKDAASLAGQRLFRR